MRKSIAVAMLLVAAALPLSAAKKSKETSKERFVDSEAYKEKDEFRSAIIDDYEDLVAGEDIEWLWVKDGVKLSDYKFKLSGKFVNKSEINDKSMMSTFNENFDEVVNSRNEKAAKGTLTVDGGVYWAERMSRGKMWIPYAGGHLAQAGAGIELVFKDSKGNVVAKMRHSGRQGDKPEEAAEELLDDVANYVADH
ncbi:MAG TPA: hypothetical protein VGF69_00565 [Thermoanaerobaculia bacterium]